MSIVSGLFRAAGLGTLVDALESQGVIKAGERVLPTTTPEMFIGSTGVENLGKAGMFDAGQALDVMKAAEKDRLRLSETEWNAKYGPMNIAFDDPARKAMMEISDENVTFKKGIDLNKLSNKDYYGFDEIFNAETLKKAYPELSEMKILLNDNPNNPALAGFDPENNVIEFNRKSRAWNSSDPLGSAVHEIQHYVQQREALTQGESFSNVLQQNAEYVDSTKLLQDSLNKSADLGYNFLKQNPKKGFTEDNLIEAFQKLREPNGLSARKALEIGFKDKTLADKFIKFANNPELKTILDLKDMSTAAYNTAIGDYMRVAGETFARQTDQRRLLTMKDRSENPAMKAIDEDRINKLYKINTQNLTESSSTIPYKGNLVQDAYFVPEWKLKEQTLEEKKLGYARKLNNPVKLADGARLSGFVDNSQEVFYGYDKNGEQFTIRKEYVKPEDIVSSRDSNKTADMIRSRLPLQTQNTEYTDPMQNSVVFADPFAPQIPQSTIPGI